jgi:hypothetical protein
MLINGCYTVIDCMDFGYNSQQQKGILLMNHEIIV